MAIDEHQEWAVVRLVTVQKKREMGRLLFATVTELSPGRPTPTSMSGLDCHSLSKSEERLFFRRTVLSKEDAVSWYRSLGEGERATPVPTREADRETWDGAPIQVPRLEDVQPWPALGLPMRQELLSWPSRSSIDPAPFVGSVPARLHRRFGDRAGLTGFIEDASAQVFVARRMHVDLSLYQEYLGSAVYIAPDPVIRQVDNFMVAAKDGRGERIVYRIVAHPGQNLGDVSVTAFDKEADLLTSFKTHRVPANGILEVDKGVCTGEYGFVVTHDRHGVLAYQPPTGFVRQVNLNVRATSRSSRNVSVPSGDSADSPRMEYQAAMGSELVSNSVLGEVLDHSASARVATEARKREVLSDAERYGQHWFPENSRSEAAQLIRELLRAARFRVMIADPYLGDLQLGQFLYAVHGNEVSVTLLITKLAFNPTTSQTKLELLNRFKASLATLSTYQQFVPQVKVLSSSSLHDRFLVVDNNVWFVGNSLNSLGEKASMIVRLPNPNEVIERLQTLGATARSLDDYIQKLSRGGTGPDE